MRSIVRLHTSMRLVTIALPLTVGLASACAPAGASDGNDDETSTSRRGNSQNSTALNGDDGGLAGALALAIDISQTSTSGLSSGGFMAVQFHVAFSSIMRGAAVFAGGPRDCAGGSVVSALTTCTANSKTLSAAAFVDETKSAAAAGDIDPVSGLANQNVFVFGGADDRTVYPTVMDATRDYYAALVTSGKVTYENRRAGTAHTMPTQSYGGGCDSTSAPYVGKCGYDGAGRALEAIYGPLNAPVDAAQLGGTFVKVAQTAGTLSGSSHSMANEGYAYVPASCAAGETCRIHVAFHGCKQFAGTVGDAFYKHAGYNEWADSNHLVILYPQTVALQNGNPNGCWDWWGYDSANYAKKSGPQMAIVRAMVDRLANGIPASATPAGSADAGAANSDGAIPEDAGAAPGKDGDDASSSSSECVLSANTDHVSAGRAYQSFGFVYAKGSNEPVGYYSPLVETSLQRTAAGYELVASCP